MTKSHSRITLAALIVLLTAGSRTAFTLAEESKVVDLSLLVASDYPCTWPQGFPNFQITHIKTIGLDSPYNVDILTIDGNTGTQIDVPTHSVARPELKFPNSGPFGNAFTETISAWQFGGEACVVDIRDLLDTGAKGVSSLVKREHVKRFEKKHRDVRFGDVVLFRSGYSDKYYRPLPAGRRFVADPLERKTPGFPNPDPDCMEYLASKKVMNLGTDSPSMGPLPNLAEPTHYAGLKYGMIWTEGATGLSQLPPTGSFYCCLGPKHKGGPYGEGRAFAVVGGDLPNRLIDSSKNKRATDLSVVLSTDLPVSSPGAGVGNHRHPYLKVDFLYAKNLDLYHHTHIMDSMAGTHLVPPSYALPPEGVEVDYPPQVRAWLAEYNRKYGQRGTSNMTTEKVPLKWTCGNARVIDVTNLVGTTNKQRWPASPEITVATIKKFEKANGELNRGDIVIFHTGHVDKHFKPKPDDAPLMADPLNGNSEGWPAPGPDTILFLAKKGIRCVATDAPDLGGVDPKRALMTYWALGSLEMVGVEFLTNVGKLPKNAYFLFAAIKIRDCHGGPGRAIALH